MNKKLAIGNEIKIFTKDGKSYQGILMENYKGYISTIAGLGVILTFPVSSIINVIKI